MMVVTGAGTRAGLMGCIRPLAQTGLILLLYCLILEFLINFNKGL